LLTGDFPLRYLRLGEKLPFKFKVKSNSRQDAKAQRETNPIIFGFPLRELL